MVVPFKVEGDDGNGLVCELIITNAQLKSSKLIWFGRADKLQEPVNIIN